MGGLLSGLVLFLFAMVWSQAAEAGAKTTLVIAASPSLAVPLSALAEDYERRHPDVAVLFVYDTGLGLRQMIAGIENHPSGKYARGNGPIHLVAPGGDELLARLESKGYIVPGTRQSYAEERLVMVAPEAWADAPESFESVAQRPEVTVALADPQWTTLGVQSREVLKAYEMGDRERLYEASDARAVLDHVLSGDADVGMLYLHQAVREQERVRILAVANRGYHPVRHSMAMQRSCPNRTLCEDFLKYLVSDDAQHLVRQAGYAALHEPGASEAAP